MYNKASNWEKIPLFFLCFGSVASSPEAGEVSIIYIYMEIRLSEVFTAYVHQSQPGNLVLDGTNSEEALSSTTHLTIAAHQDDIETIAIDGILQGLNSPDAQFNSCVVTVGHGSPM